MEKIGQDLLALQRTPLAESHIAAIRQAGIEVFGARSRRAFSFTNILTCQAPMIPLADSKDLISRLSLIPHPEGGHFKETYRSQNRVTSGEDSISRSASTAIYYLLQGREKSTWHRIRSDEMWHFYEGTPIRIYILEPDGTVEILRLGNPLRHEGASFQALVPAGRWFAAECEEPDGFSLVGCTVAPGFEFQDFEIADRSFLEQHWRGHGELIARLAQ